MNPYHRPYGRPAPAQDGSLLHCFRAIYADTCKICGASIRINTWICRFGIDSEGTLKRIVGKRHVGYAYTGFAHSGCVPLVSP